MPYINIHNDLGDAINVTFYEDVPGAARPRSSSGMIPEGDTIPWPEKYQRITWIWKDGVDPEPQHGSAERDGVVGDVTLDIPE